MSKTPEYQLKADKIYRSKVQSDEEKRKQRNYNNYRRSAISFINKAESIEDLETLQDLIEKRKKVLNQSG